MKIDLSWSLSVYIYKIPISLINVNVAFSSTEHIPRLFKAWCRYASRVFQVLMSLLGGSNVPKVKLGKLTYSCILFTHLHVMMARRGWLKRNEYWKIVCLGA